MCRVSPPPLSSLLLSVVVLVNGGGFVNCTFDGSKYSVWPLYPKCLDPDVIPSVSYCSARTFRYPTKFKYPV